MPALSDILSAYPQFSDLEDTEQEKLIKTYMDKPDYLKEKKKELDDYFAKLDKEQQKFIQQMKAKEEAKAAKK